MWGPGAWAQSFACSLHVAAGWTRVGLTWVRSLPTPSLAWVTTCLWLMQTNSTSLLPATEAWTRKETHRAAARTTILLGLQAKRVRHTKGCVMLSHRLRLVIKGSGSTRPPSTINALPVSAWILFGSLGRSSLPMCCQCDPTAARGEGDLRSQWCWMGIHRDEGDDRYLMHNVTSSFQLTMSRSAIVAPLTDQSWWPAFYTPTITQQSHCHQPMMGWRGRSTVLWGVTARCHCEMNAAPSAMAPDGTEAAALPLAALLVCEGLLHRGRCIKQSQRMVCNWECCCTAMCSQRLGHAEICTFRCSTEDCPSPQCGFCMAPSELTVDGRCSVEHFVLLARQELAEMGGVQISYQNVSPPGT